MRETNEVIWEGYDVELAKDVRVVAIRCPDSGRQNTLIAETRRGLDAMGQSRWHKLSASDRARILAIGVYFALRDRDR